MTVDLETQDDVGLKAGERVGKYEVLGRLAAGGMAELYLAALAAQGGFRKYVALKRMLPHLLSQADLRAMFLDEARISAELQHPHVAQVFELFEDPRTGEPLLAMEFISGQTLDQTIQRAAQRDTPLPLGFVARVTHDFLTGLHAAHTFVDPRTGAARPVLHRDVNVRNVMVGFTGITKVIDFGLAKTKGRLTRTGVGVLKGTLRYISPEQLRDEKVDARSDVFSSAVVLWELLSGKKLFDGPDVGSIMNAIATFQNPPPLPEHVQAPVALIEALRRGLAANPDDRWPTAREFARAVDRAVPEAFDDAAVAERMSSLFQDKLALTRSLLSGGSVSNLTYLAERQSTAAEPATEAVVPVITLEPTLVRPVPLVSSSSVTRSEVTAEPSARPADTAPILEPTAKEPARTLVDRPRQTPPATEPDLRPLYVILGGVVLLLVLGLIMLLRS